MTILNVPLELTKGRVRKYRFAVTGEDGLPVDIRTVEFICDIKRAVGQPPLATLTTSAGIERAPTGEPNNVGYLVFDEDLFASVVIPASSVPFPFINLVAELVYYPENKKTELFKFPIRLYEEVTTSDV